MRKVPLTATGPPTSSISPPVSKPKRRKPKPLIARSLAAGIPPDQVDQEEPDDAELETHPAAAPKSD